MTNSTLYSPYKDDHTSDDSSVDWSSDSAPRKRRSTRKATNATNNSNKMKNASEGRIKKAKKPGRKPLAKVTVLPSDPKLKRKAQNRAAQRAFRERKEQFVNELQEQMRELKTSKEKREKELARENAQLKKENERLKEENYNLKDAKFTFEFPHSTANIKTSGNSHPVPMISPPATDDQVLSSPAISVSSLSDAPSGDLSDYQVEPSSASYPTASPEFSFDNTDNSDLFHEKDNLFLTDYRVPSNEADFLIDQPSEPLPQLFGQEIDLFGADSPTPFSATELDPLFSEQMQQLVEEDNSLIRCTHGNQKPCKEKILAVLNRAKGANRRMFQVNQDLKNFCPDINLDQLCEDLKRKINFDTNHILSDADVDIYIECIKRTT